MFKVNSQMFKDFYLCNTLFFYKNVNNFQQVLPTNQKSIEGVYFHKAIDLYNKNLLGWEFYLEKSNCQKAWDSYIKKHHNNKSLSELEFNVPVKLNNNNFLLSGRIDYFLIEDGHLTLIDWKTSKGNLFSKLSSKLQLLFYAYAISKKYYQSNITIKTVFINENYELSKDIFPDDLLNVEKLLMDIVKKDFTNKIPNPVKFSEGKKVCDFCDFFNFCEELL